VAVCELFVGGAHRVEAVEQPDIVKRSELVAGILRVAGHEGLEERLITDNEEHRIYMRMVRDADGKVLGYYERYEPPKVGQDGCCD